MKGVELNDVRFTENQSEIKKEKGNEHSGDEEVNVRPAEKVQHVQAFGEGVGSSGAGKKGVRSGLSGDLLCFLPSLL